MNAEAIDDLEYDDEHERCAHCGDVNPPHWGGDGWYCDECAACEVCGSPYCDDEEHWL